jgi:hypothetical protein
MAKIHALASFIALVHGDRVATLAHAGEAFALDFSHFAHSNNRVPLNEAVAALAKGPKDKAIGEAINAGYVASGLTIGYIGAQSGAFKNQPAETQAMYNEAIDKAVAAFALSLDTCEAFAEKAKKSDAEKATAKAEKEAKALEASEALITAKIQAGELVRATDVKALDQASSLALAEALHAMRDKGTISPQAFALIGDMVNLDGVIAQSDIYRAECEALRAECEALHFECATFRALTVKPVKATKKAPATV